MANAKTIPLNSEMSLTDQALVFIRDAIESRTLKAGEEIDFNALCDQLGMSRTPIRESIRQLHTEGLLELLPAGRIRVAQLSLEESSEYYKVREALEVAAARAAAVHISEYDIEMLKLALKQFDMHRDQPEKLIKIDKLLHSRRYNASNNRYMSRTLNRFRIILGLIKGQPFEDANRIECAFNEHQSIINALEKHSPDEAEAAVVKHLLNAQKARLLKLKT